MLSESRNIELMNISLVGVILSFWFIFFKLLLYILSKLTTILTI